MGINIIIPFHNFHLIPSKNELGTIKIKTPFYSANYWIQPLHLQSITHRRRRRRKPIAMAAAALPISTKIKQQQQDPSIQTQKITIQNKYGEKLVGILNETGSTEIVILCHGFRSRKETNILVNVAAALGNEGISAFRFDFSGNGESEGLFQYGNYYREADDLHAVIQHFSGASRVITAILGHSKGGNVVLLYASKYHGISNVVNVSGRYNLEKGIEDRLGKDFLPRIKKEGFIDVKINSGSYRVTEESLMDRLNTNMHDACLQIDKDCRVLTVHGSADQVIPAEDALEFDKIIPNHRLHVIEGANHGYTAHQDELIPVVLAFIKESLSSTKEK